jgi:hypothetical protein
VVGVLRDILAETPDDGLFDDGKAHAMPKTALCGAPAHLPAPTESTVDCILCTSLLAQFAP